MENTIRVQDHPLVALGNRNLQTIAEHAVAQSELFEEMHYDGYGMIDPEPVPFDDKDTESILNDLPF
tara:strand:- start:71 stop:271 length:201 start_codon:yes stop_codon:yes gene_type:complete